jgi:hypothetical protein
MEQQTPVCGPGSSPGMVGQDKWPTNQAHNAQSREQGASRRRFGPASCAMGFGCNFGSTLPVTQPVTPLIVAKVSNTMTCRPDHLCEARNWCQLKTLSVKVWASGWVGRAIASGPGATIRAGPHFSQVNERSPSCSGRDPSPRVCAAFDQWRPKPLGRRNYPFAKLVFLVKSVTWKWLRAEGLGRPGTQGVWLFGKGLGGPDSWGCLQLSWWWSARGDSGMLQRAILKLSWSTRHPITIIFSY